MDSINPSLHRSGRSRQKPDDPHTLAQRIRSGDRVALGKAITLVESRKPEHLETARTIVEACLPHAGHSIRIGVTGPPGVGKSTFIESFGSYLIRQGHSVAVLAIDPSSSVSKGSILGDKTRMTELSANPKSFIRPSPSGDTLGGVARKTRETIFLAEAAGYDIVLIETVGVGQSETAVHNMTDFFLLLLLPGAGDELQGIKRGIVELADLLVINKADGGQKDLAAKARRDYRNALHLFPPKESGWQPRVLACSALEQTGLDDIWQAIEAYRLLPWFHTRRTEQSRYWLHESIRQALDEAFFQSPQVKQALQEVEKKVSSGQWSSFHGADFLLNRFFDK